jgi:NADP-dependent 3-hydroxy acid dehydrogenase YdfG
MQHYGRVDILVDNARLIQVSPIRSATLGRFPASDGDDVLGRTLYHTGAAATAGRPCHSGRIVNVTSVGGKGGVPHHLLLCLSQVCHDGFSEGLSANWQQRYSGHHHPRLERGLT